MNDSIKIMELLKEVNSLMDKGLKKYFSTNEITVTQLAVVNILAKREMVKLKELSEELKITPTAVYQIIWVKIKIGGSNRYEYFEVGN